MRVGFMANTLTCNIDCGQGPFWIVNGYDVLVNY